MSCHVMSCILCVVAREVVLYIVMFYDVLCCDVM